MTQQTILIQISERDFEAVVDRSVSNALKKNSLPLPPSQGSIRQEPISPEELCKRLDISKPTAWAWDKKGIIRGYNLGNRKYYIWEEVLLALTKKGGVPL